MKEEILFVAAFAQRSRSSLQFSLFLLLLDIFFFHRLFFSLSCSTTMAAIARSAVGVAGETAEGCPTALSP